MEKERQPLTKREKVLIGLSIVGAGVAGYFAYGYFRSVKIADRLSDDLGEAIKEKYAMYAIKDAKDALEAALNNEE